MPWPGGEGGVIGREVEGNSVCECVCVCGGGGGSLLKGNICYKRKQTWHITPVSSVQVPSLLCSSRKELKASSVRKMLAFHWSTCKQENKTS